MQKTAENIINEAIRRYKNGDRCIDIAKRLSVGVKTIYNWLEEAKIPRLGRHRPELLKAKSLKMYSDGVLVRDITQVLGVAERTIYRWLNAVGAIKKQPKDQEAKYKAIRRSIEGKAWRLAVFERDGFRCVTCEQVGGRLNAHHILGFVRYPAERFNVANGVTLCEDCHKDLHSKKRRKTA